MTNTEKFHNLVAEEMEATGKPRHEAHTAVCRKHPDIRERYVAEHNAIHRPGRGVRRAI